MPSSAAVGRVNAIDAAMLDGALLGLLASLARQALKHAPQAVRDGAAPALVPDGALLPALLFGATVLRGRPTPGMAMQNLRWEAADGSGALALRRRLALLAATVGARWAWGALGERLQALGWHSAPAGSVRARCAQAAKRADAALSVLSLAHYVHFLATGGHRSLGERLVGVRLAYAAKDSRRQLGFEFMNQQLVWTGFTDFMLFVMSVVDVRGLRQRWAWALRAGGAEGGGAGKGGAAGPGAGRCGICAAEDVGISYAAQCGHAFCYYCVASAFPASVARGGSGGSFACPVCAAAGTLARV